MSIRFDYVMILNFKIPSSLAWSAVFLWILNHKMIDVGFVLSNKRHFLELSCIFFVLFMIFLIVRRLLRAADTGLAGCLVEAKFFLVWINSMSHNIQYLHMN